jgi:hypothetical protein
MTENPFELPLDIAAIVLPFAADVIQHAATAALAPCSWQQLRRSHSFPLTVHAGTGGRLAP